MIAGAIKRGISRWKRKVLRPLCKTLMSFEQSHLCNSHHLPSRKTKSSWNRCWKGQWGRKGELESLPDKWGRIPSVHWSTAKKALSQHLPELVHPDGALKCGNSSISVALSLSWSALQCNSAFFLRWNAVLKHLYAFLELELAPWRSEWTALLLGL